MTHTYICTCGELLETQGSCPDRTCQDPIRSIPVPYQIAVSLKKHLHAAQNSPRSTLLPLEKTVAWIILNKDPQDTEFIRALSLLLLFRVEEVALLSPDQAQTLADSPIDADPRVNWPLL